jgi:bla regulator protein BlaR1
VTPDLTSALSNHLWQSTLFAIAAGLLTLALRKNHARARYWLWLIASLKFLLPFSLLVGFGSSFEWSQQTALRPSSGLSLTVDEISRPFISPIVPFLTQPAAAAPLASALPRALFIVWLCGFGAVAFFWWIRWHGVYRAARAATPLPLGMSVPVLSSPLLLEPGVFGIFRPVLILPEGMLGHFAPAQLHAILAHELCHVRRRDNLAAAVHMLIEAVFWFHPLVWWIGKRLVEERERACDEEVLRLGSAPEIYAESILKTCRFYLESPVPCVSGITGSDLKKRIVRIMTHSVANNLGLGRKLLLAAAGVAAVVAPIVFGLMNAPLSRAQAPAPVSPTPSFEVASIKPDKSGGPGMGIMFQPGGRFTAKNISLKMLIRVAYHVQDFQITGGPPWLASDRYDIEAKSPLPDGDVRTMTEEQRERDFDRRKLMLQALLADRFKLTLHKESKEAPIYALVVAKNGPKIKEATAEELGPPPDPKDLRDKPNPKGPFRGQGIRMGRGELTGQAAKLSFLADVLSNQPEVGRTVLDKTGLAGAYDFTLKWSPEEPQGPGFKGPGDAPPPPDPNGPSLFTALEEQLGLKLESQKGPVEILVIDHAEKASEN